MWHHPLAALHADLVTPCSARLDNQALLVRSRAGVLLPGCTVQVDALVCMFKPTTPLADASDS